MFYSPERVALAGLAVFILLLTAAPLVVVYPISWGSLGFAALCYATFFLGCLVVPTGKRSPVGAWNEWRFSAAPFWCFLAMGLAGMALRAYDKYFLRGVSLAESALEGRALLSEEAAGPVAALGGALYPFCYVPLMLLWARREEQPLGSMARVLAVLAFLLPAAEALILLSRSQLLVALGLMYAAAACLLFRGQAMNVRLAKYVAASVVTLIGVSIYVFQLRLGEMNLELGSSILTSVYGYTLTPSQRALEVMSIEEGVWSSMTSVLPILQYYLHGIFEFGLLWERPDPQVFSFGFQHLAPYVKVLNVLGLVSYPDVGNDLYLREGAYTSFFGPLWLDFGWFGPLVMLALGILCKLCARSARAGRVGSMPLHAHLCVVVFFMPVINLLVSAQGGYLINAFVVVWLSSFFWSRRIRADGAFPNKPNAPGRRVGAEG